MTAPESVTQADREAAARVWSWVKILSPEQGEQILLGEWDEADIVQAFARHRQSAEAASREREARLVEALGKARRLGDELGDALTSRMHGARLADEDAKLLAWDKFSFGELRAALAHRSQGEG